MTPTGYGPNDRCQRTKCVNELPPHLGGVHLDQRHELYDGPSNLLQVLPLEVRDSAYRLVREAPTLMPEAVDMAKHIQWLRDQIAHVRVDADRRERRAMALAESCEQHGKDIVALNEQLHAISESDRKNNAGRVALLGLLHTIEDFVRGWDEGRYNKDAPVADLIPALDKAAKQASAAHARAWRDKPAPKSRADAQGDLFAPEADA